MRIEQVTKADHDRRVGTWYQAALNDPSVLPFLQTGTWRGAPAPEASDWSSAFFMDEHNRGLLSVSLDRDNTTASLALWVLDRDKATAAALMRFAIHKVPALYPVSHLSFAVSSANLAWHQRVLKVARQWHWGTEPQAAWHMPTRSWVGVARFKIPVTAVNRQGHKP